MKCYDRSCLAELGSMTSAAKAQSTLATAAIPSAIVKTESSSRRGCSYGIRFSCQQRNNVKMVLSAARIPVKRWDPED